MRTRLILPDRLRKSVKPWDFIKEGDFFSDELAKYNSFGYNIYYFPNYNSKTAQGKYLRGDDIDVFEWLFVDMDLKDEIYKSKEEFLLVIRKFELSPTKIIDSGNGIHVYWKTSGLTRELFISTQKRLIEKFKTDKSIFTPLQLMRLEGYNNTKKETPIPCRILSTTTKKYLVEDFDKILPILAKTDLDRACKQYAVKKQVIVDGEIPKRFLDLLDSNEKLSTLYYEPEDRSSADYKLARIMLFNDFKYNETVEVICTTQKGAERGTDYAISTVERAYSEPVTEFSLDFREVSEYVNRGLVRGMLENEIKEYKVQKEYNKVKIEKERESRRGRYSLKNTGELKKNYFNNSLDLLKTSIRTRLPFITDRLTDVVPLEGIEVILVAAQTGSGKTQCAVNASAVLLESSKKVLFITTEERSSDLYSKISCLQKGFNWTNKRNWTDAQWNDLKKANTELVDKGDLMIVDSYVEGTDEETGRPVDPLDLSSLDDFKMLLNSISRDKIGVDVLLVDYISKIGSSSSEDQEWMVIFKTVKFIEEWCKDMKIPAVVFSQLKNKVKDTDEFQTRLPGSKRIMNAVTCAIEISTDFDNKTATYICHKNRNGNSRFVKTVRYDRGKYIDTVGQNDSIEIKEED